MKKEENFVFIFFGLPHPPTYIVTKKCCNRLDVRALIVDLGIILQRYTDHIVYYSLL